MDLPDADRLAERPLHRAKADHLPMIVTGAKFAIIGEALFGKRWKAPLSLDLGKSERTLHDYVAGITNVPRDVRQKLAIICHTRGTALVRLALELDPHVMRAAGKAAADEG